MQTLINKMQQNFRQQIIKRSEKNKSEEGNGEVRNKVEEKFDLNIDITKGLMLMRKDKLLT